MAKNKPTNKQAVYIRALAENEYVQKQLGNAAMALGKAYRRALRGRGRAVEDKKLYSHLREGATSLRNAIRALRRTQPQPEPKRLGRNLIAIAAAGGATALLVRRLGRQKEPSEMSNSSASDDGAGAAAGRGSPPLSAVQAPAEAPIDVSHPAHQPQEES
jgi:hypothetical protein